jgi:hypothetical protein
VARVEQSCTRPKIVRRQVTQATVITISGSVDTPRNQQMNPMPDAAAGVRHGIHPKDRDYSQVQPGTVPLPLWEREAFPALTPSVWSPVSATLYCQGVL